MPPAAAPTALTSALLALAPAPPAPPVATAVAAAAAAEVHRLRRYIARRGRAMRRGGARRGRSLPRRLQKRWRAWPRTCPAPARCWASSRRWCPRQSGRLGAPGPTPPCRRRSGSWAALRASRTLSRPTPAASGAATTAWCRPRSCSATRSPRRRPPLPRGCWTEATRKTRAWSRPRRWPPAAMSSAALGTPGGAPARVAQPSWSSTRG
mmetsp:Transcript_1411/g.5075  ORF Transcript_1411/g.5075 Transcript_1411/m.5075 type:complete len:209 (+) Transcript_1411:291-917(+)